MATVFQRIESKVFGLMRRVPPRSRLARLAVWLLAVSVLSTAARFIPGGIGRFFAGFADFSIFLLIVVSIPVLTRWVFRRLLWRVRDRLIVTYLLMGLAPIVLFVTLALLALYVFSGQFAIFAANSLIDTELSHIASENRTFAVHVSNELATNPKAKAVSLPEYSDSNPDHEQGGLRCAAFFDGKEELLEKVDEIDTSIHAVPGWASSDFRGVVLDKGRLYFRAIHTHTRAGHTTTVISSMPVSEKSLELIASGLGRVTIIPSFGLDEDTDPSGQTPPDTSAAHAPATKPGLNITMGPQTPNQGVISVNGRDVTKDQENPDAISGGKLPPSQHLYDLPVGFYAPLKTTEWDTGKRRSINLDVISLPSLLYQRLFITSLEMAAFVRAVLIGIGIFFAVLELIAFIMAVRLNQTITRSIHDLYEATERIDKGDLSHRIVVQRDDQLGALSGSFNRMTASLERLLQEQREKQRLQNELAIAQEVQANLFPRDNVSLPTLELHGVCRPARTVSGDYYDFLLFGDTGLGLALGDISGKGISAALLMATLHSAVRAYRFAGEELVYEGSRAIASGSTSIAVEEIDGGEWFESPGKILALLNRHLYRSTQPEKYATLFLAHYDARTSRLTYSNGGQLPPLVLRTDNSITRLDCGGTVVGLMDGMSYEQDTVVLRSGDIVIAYSDGVTEPENEFGDFGEDRLVEIVRRSRHLPLAAISEQVMQALRNWIGAEEQPDDITLVLARQV